MKGTTVAVAFLAIVEVAVLAAFGFVTIVVNGITVVWAAGLLAAAVAWICPSEIWDTTGTDDAAIGADEAAAVTWICPSEIWDTTGAEEAAADPFAGADEAALPEEVAAVAWICPSEI